MFNAISPLLSDFFLKPRITAKSQTPIGMLTNRSHSEAIDHYVQVARKQARYVAVET